MNKILIIYDTNNEHKDLLIDRITSLDKNCCVFLNNCVIIETEHTPKEVYEIIQRDELDKTLMFVTTFDNTSCWGLMHDSFWKIRN